MGGVSITWSVAVAPVAAAAATWMWYVVPGWARKVIGDWKGPRDPTSERSLSAEPVNTVKTGKAQHGPPTLTLNRVGEGGFTEYHTLALTPNGPGGGTGSPVSRVAETRSTVSEKGRLPMLVASSKLSFTGEGTTVTSTWYGTGSREPLLTWT